MALLGMLVGLATASVRAEQDEKAPFEPTETREFDVLVDDRPVGIHVMRIREDGQQAVVAMRSDVEVRVLLYRYVYVFDSQETWDGHRLVSFHSLTSDNGKKIRVQLKRDANHSLVQFQDHKTKIEPPHQTTAYSRLPPGVEKPRTLRLLNLDDGESVSVTWSPGEEVKLQVADRSIPCRKWIVNGAVNAELWFDRAGWLVRQRTLERGHRSELRLTSIRQGRIAP
jgi:hypothetical protein